MKKLSIVAIVALLGLGGKCYYQKSKVESFLDSFSEYGYSYNITKSSLCSMDIDLKLEDPKKIINIYPKFLKENRVFMKGVKAAFSKDKTLKELKYKYSIKLPIFGFNVVATRVVDSKKEVKNFSDFIANEFRDTTTTCSILTNKCHTIYKDIDSTYNSVHYQAKGMSADVEYKGKRAFDGVFRASLIKISDKKSDFIFKDLAVDVLYKDSNKFDIQQVIKAKEFSIVDKSGEKGVLSGLKIGFGYFEDKKGFVDFGVDSFELLQNSVTLKMDNFGLNANISSKSGYKFNIDSLTINSKEEKFDLVLNKLNSSYKFLDNNIYLANGKTTLALLDIKAQNAESINIKDVNLKSNPTIKGDKLNLSEIYSIAAIKSSIKKADFELSDAKIDLAVKDIGYSVIKDLYNEIKEVYKDAFIAGFYGDRLAMLRVDREVRKIASKYMPRFPEVLKYGIKAKIKDSGFKKFVFEGKEAKDLNINGALELLKITINDIMSKKYNENNLPIKSLNVEAKIPSTLLEIANVNEQTLPFKLKSSGEFKIVEIGYKDGKITVNGEPIK